MQSNALYRLVLTTQLNLLANLAKWSSVPLRTKWVRVPMQSLKTLDIIPASSKKLLDIQTTIECGFTLKNIHELIIKSSEMHRTDK